jgi:hypothetical protein
MQVRASRELIHHVLDVPKSNHGAAGAHRLDRLEVLLLESDSDEECNCCRLRDV